MILSFERGGFGSQCGGIVLEEALDLSSDRLLNNNNNLTNNKA